MTVDLDEERYVRQLEVTHANGLHNEPAEDCPRCAAEAERDSVERAGEGRCYSDHNEDIRVKGSCDYCGESVRDE